ncbi:MAG: hypothetical protein GXP31_03595 [Kiritimatiellaeota bacterium]|nr:hypothetical protein [Kiritimatiellota bacterium]
MNSLFRRVSLFLGCAALFGVAAAWACDTPVYQYARMNWESDAYDVVVFHRGPLDAESAALTAQLKKAAEQVNFVLHLVDLDKQKEAFFNDLYAKTGVKSLPALALLYPPKTLKDRLIWSGPLAAGNVAKLLDSPARRSVFRELDPGQTAAVWVFQPGPNAKERAATEKRLRQLLKDVSKEVRDVFGGQDDQEPPSFKIVVVERDAAVEDVFRSMLTHIEPDLKDYTDKSMVVPVFGRGRALFALVGDGINRDTITQTVGFLLGACSCEVKAMNPGVDLLLRGRWREMGAGDLEYGEVALSPLRGVSAVIEAEMDPQGQAQPAAVSVPPAQETALVPKEQASPAPGDAAAAAPPAAPLPSEEKSVAAGDAEVEPAPLPPAAGPGVVVGTELPEARSRLAKDKADTGKVMLLWLALGTVTLGLFALAAGGVVWMRLGRGD